MRRRIPFALPVAILAALAISSHGQEVLKPFRLGPPTEPEPEIPKAVPLKPFRPSEPAPPPGDEEIPKAVPVKKPTPTPAPAIPIVPNPPLAPSSAPTPRPPRTMTDAVRPPTAEMPDPADIVVGRTAPTTADQVQLQYADNYYSKKMWRDAAAEYERYLDQFRKAPAADRQAVYYRLGECYRQTGAVNNAKANYEALLTNFSGGEFLGYAAYRLASIQYEEKDYRSALQSYRRASVRLTQPVLMHASRFFVGRCMEALGQKNEARQQYDELSKIVENNPFRDASRLSTGRLFADATQREQALKWLQPLAAETTNPQIKAEALARTGLLLADLARPNEASKVFDAALALPEIGVWKDELLAAKFRILYDQKDYKGVLARYQSSGASLQKIENKLNVLVTVANSQRELGMREEALATYAQIGQDFPATQQARDAAYARLVMMYDAGDDRLLNEVNVFLADNPAAPQVDRVSLMKAEAVFKAGDFEHAAPIYEEVIGRTKALPGGYKGEATFKLGWCWVQLGHLDKAVETFTAFLREFPTHVKVPTALAQRGSAQMQLRQYSAAQKDFAELVARHPKAKEREYGLENLALIHGQLGDQARMAETFEMLLAEFPQTAARPKAHYWIGRTAFEMKNYKKAVPHLDQARKLDKEQFFERSSLALMACLYNIEDVDATEKEIEFYKKNGGKAATPSDVIRWLGQKFYERGQFERGEKFLRELILRKEAVGEDYLLLARSRVKMSKFKDAVDSFDHYLASTKDPVPRVAGMIEKADAQIGLKDWAGADRTVKEGLSLATEGRYNGELRLRAGDVEAGRGDPKKALQIFEAIPVTLDDNDVSPRALEREMELHAKLGNTAEAKRVENQLRSKYPEYMQKKRAPIP